MTNEKKAGNSLPNELMTFNFAESQTQIRSIFLKEAPWLVAKDVCDAIGLPNTSMALSKLDEDEKLTSKLLMSGQNRKMWLVSESGLYALIMRSNKPEAKKFRKWVTSEVLPQIRKKGFYVNSGKPQGSFIDARSTPYHLTGINDYNVRVITINGVLYYSMGDINRAIKCSTSTGQTAKKLNKVDILAIKILLFGSTHPAWFTTQLGLQLILSGSRILKDVLTNQLMLNPTNKKEGANV